MRSAFKGGAASLGQCGSLKRRDILLGTLGVAAAAVMGPYAVAEAREASVRIPASVVTDPPRAWGNEASPVMYPDPDVITIDKAFKDYINEAAAIRRLATGFGWLEGPAWSNEGQYLVFSDTGADTQYRLLWDDRRVTAFRRPSYNSNGNTFDFQGRQISTEQFYRRVVRWEHDGTMTVIADSFEGSGLNSPNDLVPHPDGSIWFTDPPYGDSLTEGRPDDAGGLSNPHGLLNAHIGSPAAVVAVKRRLPTNVYRWDTSGSLEVVVTEEQISNPNGICFSPDYKTLFVIGDDLRIRHGDSGPGVVYAFDVRGRTVGGQRIFTDMSVDGVHCDPDGMRADVFGNLWCSSAASLGYAGVLVYNAHGKLIGRIRLPEQCGNVAFGGPKRNMLLMCASQSLYVLPLETQGAAPG